LISSNAVYESLGFIFEAVALVPAGGLAGLEPAITPAFPAEI